MSDCITALPLRIFFKIILNHFQSFWLNTFWKLFFVLIFRKVCTWCKSSTSPTADNRINKILIQKSAFIFIKSDLIFLEPILNKLGVTVDQEKLLAAYNEKVARFKEIKKKNKEKNESKTS